MFAHSSAQGPQIMNPESGMERDVETNNRANSKQTSIRISSSRTVLHLNELQSGPSGEFGPHWKRLEVIRSRPPRMWCGKQDEWSKIHLSSSNNFQIKKSHRTLSFDDELQPLLRPSLPVTAATYTTGEGKKEVRTANKSLLVIFHFSFP